MKTHTSRTLEYLRNRGYYSDVIEKWIPNPKHPGGGFRRDYFGFGDILAFDNIETVIVQSCGSSFSQHKNDMLKNGMITVWLAAHRRVLLIGWRKLKLKKGGKAMRWKPRVAEFYSFNNELTVEEG